MKQGSLKLWLLALAAVALVAVPLSAQPINIQKGTDNFNTPNDGNSSVFLTNAQLDALCEYNGAPHALTAGGLSANVRGVNLGNGSNTDTKIIRLDPAYLRSVGDSAKVGIEVTGMKLVTTSPISTNCGALTVVFTANPPDGIADSTMTITLTSSAGGDFQADIVVPMSLQASGAQNGTATHYYSLPSDSKDPWSVKPAASPVVNSNFNPGVLPGGGGPVMLCRGKLLPAWHCYKPAKRTCPRGPGPVVANAVDINPCGVDIEPIDDEIVPIDDYIVPIDETIKP